MAIKWSKDTPEALQIIKRAYGSKNPANEPVKHKATVIEFDDEDVKRQEAKFRAARAAISSEPGSE